MDKIYDRYFPRERLLEKENLFDSDTDSNSANSYFLEPMGDSQENKVEFVCYQWDLYTVGYKYAADLIVNRGLDAVLNYSETRRVHPNDGYHQLAYKTDIVVYPVIFLYRQYLENRLKAMIMKNKILELMESDDSIDTTLLLKKPNHNLNDLWEKCKEILRNRCEEFEYEDEIELKIMGEYISEYCKMDEDSFVSRYPMSKQGDLYCEDYVMNIPKAISLRNLCKIMDKIFHYLELQNGYLDAEIEMKEEEKYEFQASL